MPVREAELSKIKSNRGFSLIEVIVVVAIMTVMLVAGAFGVSMLVGADAKQVATKLDAQLDDVKTGAMSRAGEVMIIRFIDATGAEDTAAKMGVSRTGFYAVKTVSTIKNDADIIDFYSDVEYSYLGDKKVKILVTSAGDYEIKDKAALKIEFDRASGAIKKATKGDMDGTSYSNTTFTPAASDSDITATLKEMTFSSGLSSYKMTIYPMTGKHELE